MNYLNSIHALYLSTLLTEIGGLLRLYLVVGERLPVRRLRVLLLLYSVVQRVLFRVQPAAVHHHQPQGKFQLNQPLGCTEVSRK